MPQDEFDAQFFDQFLDDFFAEADEHLRSVRRHLLTFEDALAAGQAIPANTLNELFRSFHTLKGISAMANVSAAESLAHHMENYLRLLRDGQAAFSHEGLDALIDSTRKLEHVVAARRVNSEIPNINAELRRLETLISSLESGSSEQPSLADSEPDPEESEQRRGVLYRFVFQPSNELADRNVNVNAIRSRLEAIGAIRESKPTIKADGRVAFEFVVMVNAAYDNDPIFEEWRGDGVAADKLEPESSLSDEAQAEPVIEHAVSESAKTGLFGQSNVVRVDLSRLDELMLMVGELVISRARLAETAKQIERYLPAKCERDLHEINQTIEKQLRTLRDGVMRVRMVPIGDVFERMQFVARDVARETDKRIRLEITGENTEIDKLLVEGMLDPLLHLVRNAISHGIESPSEREAVGKPADGCVRLHAATVGETVVIEISDDGRGIDRKAVAAKARTLGLLSDGEDFDDAALLDVLCSPGFTTKTEADKTSGRGVGMDVVKRNTDELGGTIALETKRGEGTTFVIRLPLTLAIADALIVTVDKERFAVPQSSVREVLEIEPDSVTRFENNEVIEYRGEAMPLVRLAKLFHLDRPKDEDKFHALVVDHGNQRVGISVDRVVGQREIVIRAIDDPIAKVRGISGATELGDGRAVLILNVAEIAQEVR